MRVINADMSMLLMVRYAADVDTLCHERRRDETSQRDAGHESVQRAMRQDGMPRALLIR